MYTGMIFRLSGFSGVGPFQLSFGAVVAPTSRKFRNFREVRVRTNFPLFEMAIDGQPEVAPGAFGFSAGTAFRLTVVGHGVAEFFGLAML